MTDDAQHVLEGYLADLQAGRRPDRSALQKQHPDLADALECLEVLDTLAPPVGQAALPVPAHAPPERDANPDLAPTLPTHAARNADAVDSTDNAVGRLFGKYLVEGELGRGGMGVVFKARQQDLGRQVALKMILSSHLASADHVARFQDEAKAAAGLHHPNIVAIYEAGQLNGQPYFAMQYVAGPSLSQRLRDGPLSPEAAADIVQRIARAVAHLHRQGFLHRDLKPSNILLDEAGNPYVTDFGLAKMLSGDSHRTGTGVIVGTPSYMSPEQAAGHGDRVGPLSDVYSLGAILYELLTGRPPFAGNTPLDTLVQVIESEPTLPRWLKPELPADLETICLRCLEKNPHERYASAAALANDLERFLKNEVIEARPPGLVNRVRRWVRREPALASRLVMLALCFGVIQLSYHLVPGVPLSLHLAVVGILAAWAALSVVCQHFLLRERWAEIVPYVWSALDLILFSAALYVDNALQGQVLVGYPLLVAASGLWFRDKLVWFTMLIAELAYGLVLWEWRMRHATIVGLHKDIMFMVGLAILAFIVSYQVNRVRALSRYYEHRPLP